MPTWYLLGKRICIWPPVHCDTWEAIAWYLIRFWRWIRGVPFWKSGKRSTDVGSLFRHSRGLEFYVRKMVARAKSYPLLSLFPYCVFKQQAFFLRRNHFFFFFVPSNYTNSHYFSIFLPVDFHVFQAFLIIVFILLTTFILFLAFSSLLFHFLFVVLKVYWNHLFFSTFFLFLLLQVAFLVFLFLLQFIVLRFFFFFVILFFCSLFFSCFSFFIIAIVFLFFSSFFSFLFFFLISHVSLYIVILFSCFHSFPFPYHLSSSSWWFLIRSIFPSLSFILRCCVLNIFRNVFSLFFNSSFFLYIFPFFSYKSVFYF